MYILVFLSCLYWKIKEKNIPLGFKMNKYCRSVLNSCQGLLLFPLSIILYTVNYSSSDWRFKHIRKNGFIFTLLGTKKFHWNTLEFKDSLIPKFHSVMVLCLLKLALSHGGSSPLSALTHIYENIYVKHPKRGKSISCFHPNPLFLFYLCLQDDVVPSQGVGNRKVTFSLLRRKIPAAGPAPHGLWAKCQSWISLSILWKGSGNIEWSRVRAQALMDEDWGMLFDSALCY